MTSSDWFTHFAGAFLAGLVFVSLYVLFPPAHSCRPDSDAIERSIVEEMEDTKTRLALARAAQSLALLREREAQGYSADTYTLSIYAQ